MLATLLGIGSAKRSLENPNLSLNDPEAWEEAGLLEGKTDSGIRVGPESALTYAPVWQAVSMISGDFAKLPLDVFRRKEDEERERDRKHWAFRLLRRRANEEQTAFKWKRTAAIHLLMFGNAYSFIDWAGNGVGLGLYNLLPDRTEVKRREGKLYYVTETRHPDGDPWLRWILSEDVIHFAGLTGDGIRGYELVKKARHSWALGLVQQKFASRFYKSGGRVGGVLEVPVAASDEYANTLEVGWRKLYESDDGWFKTAILRDGSKFHSASHSPADGEMNESREQQARDVARWFNLPPSRLGVAGSVSYNSSAEANQVYLDTTLDPILVDAEQEIEEKLLGSDGSRFVEFNRNALLRLNPKERAAVNAIAIRSGWKSPDEVRSEENKPPRPDGRGGEYVDVARAKSTGGTDKGENDKPRGDGKDPADEQLDETTRHARRRVIFNIGARARHKAKSARAWQEWLDGNLASHRAEASELCGDESVVETVLLRLRPTVEHVGVQDLPAAVDRLMTEFERAA